MTDTYDGPARNATDLADETIGHLLHHADAVQRYQALDLIAERTTWLRAITIKQLEIDLGGVSAAADALGISRQAVTELYAKTETPGPRADLDREARPAYVYGWWLGCVQHIAQRTGRDDHFDKLLDNAARTTAAYPAMQRSVEDWLRRLTRGRRSTQAQPLRDMLDATGVDDAIATLGSRHLSTAQQGDVWIGLHQAQARKPWST